MKVSKKTWIYGRSVHRKNAPPISYPPIVPRMDQETYEQIVDLFRWGAERRADAMRRDVIPPLEQDVETYDMPTTPIGRRRLEVAKRKLREAQEALRKAESFGEHAEAEALRLCLVKGIRKVFVRKGTLVAVTAPIKIGSVKLGTYDIRIEPGISCAPADVITVIRRDHFSRAGPHPHWYHDPCFGTWGPMLRTMIKRQSWASVIMGVLSFLATYDSRSPLLVLSSFAEGGRLENEDPLA